MATKADKTGRLGGTAIKPVGWDRTGWEKFRYMLYDPQKGEILTRTPMSWLKIFVFYCIYYTCLAGFWLACLHIFFLTLPEGRPRWTLKDSLIGLNPGVGLRPKMADVQIESSLYRINTQQTSTEPSNEKGEGKRNADIAKRAKLFLDMYNNTKGLADDCSGNKPCKFDLSLLGDCNAYPYGFLQGNPIQPCFFIKLNKIYKFKPFALDLTTIDANQDMSDHIKAKIKAGGAQNVYFDCYGRYPADNEGAGNKGIGLKFYPESQAIPLDAFPFMGGNYHAPLVAVKVTNPPIGRLVHLECKAWYGGVTHSTKDKMGLTQFELLVESVPVTKDDDGEEP